MNIENSTAINTLAVMAIFSKLAIKQQFKLFTLRSLLGCQLRVAYVRLSMYPITFCVYSILLKGLEDREMY